MVTALLMRPSVQPPTHSLIHPFIHRCIHHPSIDSFSRHQAPIRKDGQVPSFRALSLSAELTLTLIDPDTGCSPPPPASQQQRALAAR